MPASRSPRAAILLGASARPRIAVSMRASRSSSPAICCRPASGAGRRHDGQGRRSGGGQRAMPRQKLRLSHSRLSQLSRMGADSGPIRWAISFPDVRRWLHRGGRLGQEIEPQLPVLAPDRAGLRSPDSSRSKRRRAEAAQRAEGIFGRESVAQFGVGVIHRSMQPLSRIRLRRIQLFTVPSGAPHAARHLVESHALIVRQHQARARSSRQARRDSLEAAGHLG